MAYYRCTSDSGSLFFFMSQQVAVLCISGQRLNGKCIYES